MMYRNFKETEPFKIDKNGTQYFNDWTCRRCGGQGGAQAWAYTGYTCYECGGSGMARKPKVYKVYTPEYAAKLEARRAAKAEKQAAEYRAMADEKNAEFFEQNGFNKAGETFVALGNTYKIKEELKEAGFKYDSVLGWHAGENNFAALPMMKLSAEEVFDKNEYGWFYKGYVDADATIKAIKAENEKLLAQADKSEFLGEVGAKIEVTATLERAYEYSFCMGWKTVYSTAYTFKDEAGNTIVWKTQKYLEIKEGQKVKLSGTVKEHSTYKGKKQTVITRAKVA